ncbi:MAG: bifunctional DNA primase/polymerase [Anaerolineae bacterium]|nr:bifunctional DNA primase/polymerase [Anaerolineae bacterium]
MHKPNTRPTTQKQIDRAERTQSALFAYDMKLNPFPIAYGNKLPIKGTPIQPLDYQRLFWHESEIRKLVSQFDVNIAIKLGATSLNTFVIDIDHPGRAIEAMTRLASHQIRTLTVKSPKRGYHFYFSCTDCAIGGATFSYGDIKGQGGYVLFAGSVVGDKPYTLVDAVNPHTDTIDNLQALLTDILGETIVLKRTTYGRNTWRDLPAGAVVTQRGRWIAQYCEYLDNPTPIGNRKNKLFVNTIYAAATGKSLDAVVSAAHRDGLPQSEIERTIEAASAAKGTASPVVGGQSFHWHSALQFVDTFHGWSTGQHGNTERAVMLALIERARVDANEQGVFRASIREIKTLSQRSKTAAVNGALERLIEKGLLIRVSGKRGLRDCGVPQPVNGRVAPNVASFDSVSKKLQASRWRFTEITLQKGHSIELRSKETDVFNVSLTQQHQFMQDTRRADLLERGSIGQTGVRVYAYLMANNGAPSQAVIARALDMSTAAISRTLHKLAGQEYKIVEYVEDERRWYAVAMADDQWAELAQAEINMRGKSRYEARKERFATERHANLLHIYYTLLKGYQARLEWHEQQELANDPLLAEALSLGAKVERIA